MNYEEKQAQRQAYYKQVKKVRSAEERRLLKEHTKRRSRGGRSRSSEEWTEDGEHEHDGFERMRSAPQLDLQAAQGSAPAGSGVAGASLEGLREGLVVAVHRGRAVALADGEQVELALGPDSPRPAAGDVAYFGPGDLPRLVALGERRTVISRPDPGHGNRELVLAANVDTAVIVASVRRPELRPGLVDRFLIAIARGGAQPLLVANKADLAPSAGEREVLERQLAPFSALGLDVVWTSAATGEGLEELGARLAQGTCVFVGHSGVGKSTLLNALDPTSVRDTGVGREFDGKGRHTTTSAQLVELPSGGRLIDTPGIRSLGLWQVGRAELAGYFPEFEGPAQACRFRDCAHLVEPECGVRDAVEQGDVAEARYDAYRRILGTLEE